MPRPTKYSDAERKTRQKTWNKKVSAERKQRYKEDPVYADAIKKTMREAYQEKKGIKPREVKNCRGYLPRLKEIGRMRKTTELGDELTFNVREAATALGGYHPNVVYRWIRQGMFPKPPHLVEGHKVEHVYVESEMRSLMLAFALHQDHKLYFQAKDENTIAALAMCVM
jgi:predicted DNA-binding transcriptional regulator AlpA